MDSDSISQNLLDETDELDDSPIGHDPRIVTSAQFLEISPEVLELAVDPVSNAYWVGRTMADHSFFGDISNPFSINRLKEAWELGFKDRILELSQWTLWKPAQPKSDDWKEAFEDEWLKEGF